MPGCHSFSACSGCKGTKKNPTSKQYARKHTENHQKHPPGHRRGHERRVRPEFRTPGVLLRKMAAAQVAHQGQRQGHSHRHWTTPQQHTQPNNRQLRHILHRPTLRSHTQRRRGHHRHTANETILPRKGIRGCRNFRKKENKRHDS